MIYIFLFLLGVNQEVRPYVEKQKRARDPISVEEKLAITLRFLATGESYISLRYQFRISDSAISLFIKPVCDVIYDELKEEYLKMPSTEAEWTDIANKTFQRWHFPNCFAATDGKHIELMHLHNSGSLYINYKKLFSIVLMALADYDSKFLFVDIGFQGRISDGGVFRNYDFYGAPVCNEINLPLPTEVPQLNPWWNSTEPLPFVFVGDDAFPLTNFCMKPYPLTGLTEEERLFNFWLSHFRRIGKNTFGIWSNRFRLFSTRICMQPEKATSCA